MEIGGILTPIYYYCLCCRVLKNTNRKTRILVDFTKQKCMLLFVSVKIYTVRGYKVDNFRSAVVQSQAAQAYDAKLAK